MPAPAAFPVRSAVALRDSPLDRAVHSVGPHNSLRDYLRGRSRSALFGLLALCVSATSAACSRSPTGDSDGSRLLVVSAASDEILVLDAETGDPAGSVSVDARPGEIDEPHGIAVDSARGLWYVTLAHGEPTLWKFDVRDDRLVGRLRLGSRGAARIGLTPDGTRAFIPSYWRGDSTPGTVTAVRLQDLTVVAQPSLCPAPHDARVSPDGELVLVTCALGDEVLLLGAGTLEIRNRVAVGGEGSEATDSTPTSARPPRATPERASAPARPMNAAWAPDGESAWVTLQGANEVIGLDRDGAIFARIPVGPSPLQISIDPSGRHAVVALRGAAAVSILDIEERVETRRISVPGAVHPHGVALSAAGDQAFVSYEGSVDVPGGVVALTVPEGEILWRRSGGSYVLGIARDP